MGRGQTLPALFLLSTVLFTLIMVKIFQIRDIVFVVDFVNEVVFECNEIDGTNNPRTQRGHAELKHPSTQTIRACSSCGKPGHRRDGCPGADQKDDDELEAQIQAFKAQGMTSGEVAKDLNLPLRKVNLYW